MRSVSADSRCIAVLHQCTTDTIFEDVTRLKNTLMKKINLIKQNPYITYISKHILENMVQ